jgi:hypothetical protein
VQSLCAQIDALKVQRKNLKSTPQSETTEVHALRSQIQALKQQRKQLKSTEKNETAEQRKKNRGASPPGMAHLSLHRTPHLPHAVLGVSYSLLGAVYPTSVDVEHSASRSLEPLVCCTALTATSTC